MTRIGRGILKISQGLVLAIPVCLVSIGAEQDVRHPVRRSAHLLTDHIQVNIGAAFDNQLTMNMTDDEAVPECLHGVAEDVAADGSWVRRGISLSVSCLTVSGPETEAKDVIQKNTDK